jgi:hypothetical protein
MGYQKHPDELDVLAGAGTVKRGGSETVIAGLTC